MAIKKDMLVEKYIEALESGTIPWGKRVDYYKIA